MTILYVINSLEIGGAEKLVVDLSILLTNRGHKVNVLILNGIDTKFKALLQKAGIEVFSLDASNIYNPFLIFKIVKYMYRYDVIHTHLFPSQYWVAFAKLLSFSKVRLITTEHNTTNRRRNSLFFKYIDTLVYKIYDNIIAISYSTNCALCQYLGKSNKIITIENGIDLIPFQKALPNHKDLLFKCRKDSKVIVQVSAFREQKDQDTLIRAISELSDAYHLVLIGDGNRKDRCIDLSRDIGVGNRVHFLGIRHDIPVLLKSSDIVVLSSHWEGFGLAAVEGMAAHKPVVASNVPGLAEVVVDAGLLFDAGNYKQLASIIDHLLSDEKYYKYISNRCLNRSLRFSIGRMVDKYIGVYCLK